MVRAARFTLRENLRISEEAQGRGEEWAPVLVRELQIALKDLEREHPLPPV